ncbi:alpha-amylase family glycosyl hydrolase [Ekhidna sp.]|uniref:alpha-amylase family glycosyl hydrolase n=1 Tax=Ekhidna sp. TaxID=2608089 RepID=UPI00329A7946
MRIPLLVVSLLFTVSVFAQGIPITFEVNMSYQIQQGKFDPENEFVDIAGTFNSWGSTLNKLTDADGDSIWSTTLNVFTSGQNIEFKFRYNGEWDDREEFPGAGNNRTHTVSSGEETLAFWYNDEEPPTGPAVAKIKSSSNFTYTLGSIVFTDNSSGLIENIEWVFEGGDPVTSSDASVSVTYENPGTYDVTLRVSNSFSQDEQILNDYITVEERTTEDLAWWNESTFYEIFVRSFYDSDGDGIGDFNGITEKLDYLNDGDPNTTSDLGIEGIWLMPIHDSPSYHGYDVNDYRSINPDYGTMDDFKNFLQEAHNRGIKVIIDLVLNHSSTEISWFKEAQSSTNSSKRNWYRWSDTKPSYSGPWGQSVWHGNSPYYYGLFWGGMPDLNYEEPELKSEMFDVTRFWLEDIGIDGFRLDAVKYIYEDGSELEDLPSTHDFWREWVAVTKASNPEALSVGEAWTSTEKVVPYVVNEGLDFCFEFDLGSAILSSVKTGDALHIRNQINKVINSYPYYQFGTFATNHDQNRIMDELNSDEEKVKLIAATYLTLPGIPFIYYGEEVGMVGQKPDENIRRPMSWSNSSHAGFSTSTPWNSASSNYSTHNVEVGRVDDNSLFNWYRRLIQLRSEEIALQKGDYQEFNTQNESVFGFHRIHEGEQLLILINYGETEVIETILTSDLAVLDEGMAWVDYMDATTRIDVSGISSFEVKLAANQVRIFRPGNLTLGIDSQDEIGVFPNPSSDYLQLRNMDIPFDYQLLDLNGKQIKSGTQQSIPLIDVSKLRNGFYMLHLDSKKGSKAIKIKIE